MLIPTTKMSGKTQFPERVDIYILVALPTVRIHDGTTVIKTITPELNNTVAQILRSTPEQYRGTQVLV